MERWKMRDAWRAVYSAARQAGLDWRASASELADAVGEGLRPFPGGQASDVARLAKALSRVLWARDGTVTNRSWGRVLTRPHGGPHV